MGIRLHPRHEKRQLAGIELGQALLDIIKKFDLTFGEIFVLLSEEMRSWALKLRISEDPYVEKKEAALNIIFKKLEELENRISKLEKGLIRTFDVPDHAINTFLKNQKRGK